MWRTGKTWFFGNDVDTDQIMPTRYLALRTAEDLGKHALSGVDPSWPERISVGDIVVGGRNFGCGSSREHAPLGLKGLGLSAVVARSFSRIFYRNAINIGLPLLVLDTDISLIEQGQQGWIDVASGQFSFDGGKTALQGVAPAPVILDILSCGGLMHYVATAPAAV